MENNLASTPRPTNEPVLEYLPGSKERILLTKKIAEFESETWDIPALINGEEVRTGKTQPLIIPHHHRKNWGVYHQVTEKEVQAAIDGSLEAYKEWSEFDLKDRSAIFLRAADLLASEFRFDLNAATVLNQSKTCHQAEIDSACELIDFFRFNAVFAEQLYTIQPYSPKGQWNRLDYRPLEGFTFAVTPFNFTSIAGNLPTAPALMGNVCLWKPASTSVFSGYRIAKLLQKAGLPKGVIQFLPGSGKVLGGSVLGSHHLSGVHFTGSTDVFNDIWNTVGKNLSQYRSYPRLVGETGGKDFVFVHPSAEAAVVTTALIRGAFEFQGQKCSAASRAYIPKSLWQVIKAQLKEEAESISVGDPKSYKNFMSAVIDEKSFDKIMSYVQAARTSTDATLFAGGEGNKQEGYFIRPTIIEVKDPQYKTMQEEIFGPVLSVFVYEDKKFDETLELCARTSPYALTGAFLSNDRMAIQKADKILRHSAGNYYINNKPTGAVVGQQPFGGGRASGTNDKAGSIFNLLRWVSLRTVSETFAPPVQYRYGFLAD